MPISVVCPGCKARFTVGDKFAGKKGPCPKCKTIITIPEALTEEVKIHAPEQFASGGKDAKGRLILKPIPRKETKLAPTAIAAIVGAIAVVLVVAVAMRVVGLAGNLAIESLGLIVISPPLVVGGYTFLRNDELEPYRGKSLYLRAALCAAVYAALWGAYYPLPRLGVITGEPWQWLFVAPAFISAGAAASFACLDLDFASGAMHYCFYLAVTIGLRFVLGLPALWAAATTT